MSTIRDVAAMAGVSPSTVSRVLNHDTKYKISEETTELIWKAVAATNYKAPAHTPFPDEAEETVFQFGKPPAADKKFGCVLNIIGGKYNDPYYMTILSGFEKRIRERGYDIAFIRDNDEFANPLILHHTFQEKIDGLVLMNPFPEETYAFLKKQTPHIVGVDTAYGDIDNIAYNHYEVARMAVSHLVEKGYHDIGFIGGFKESLALSKRFKGFYSSLYEFGLTYHPEWTIFSNWDDEFCEAEIKRAFHNEGLPRAFFASSDLMAMAGLRAFFDLGLRVPEDIAIIGLTNIEVSKYVNPPLTTIELPAFDMGVIAADALIERVCGYDAPTRTITLNSTLIERSST